MQTLIIKGRLPSRNDSEKAARSHWSKGAEHKKEWQEFCQWQMKGVKPVTQPCECTVTFYEPDLRRDNDNVIAGLKFILDAMQAEKIIKNDSHKLLRLRVNPVELDRKNPRIEVRIEVAK